MFHGTKEEARKLWVEALRSGKYEQGHGALVAQIGDKMQYCCLGVACEVLAPESKGEDMGEISYFNSRSFLPGPVQTLLGVTKNDGSFIEREESIPFLTTLITLNDSRKLSFAQIADVIESAPEGLFND